MSDHDEKEIIGLLMRIAGAVDEINQKLTPSEPKSLQVNFGQPVPKLKEKLDNEFITVQCTKYRHRSL